MNKTELSIGDIVAYNNTIYRITGLGIINACLGPYKVKNNKNSLSIPYSLISPVKLIKEDISNNSLDFEKFIVDNVTYYYYKFLKLGIKDNKDCFEFYSIEVLYVHQLQHIFRLYNYLNEALNFKISDKNLKYYESQTKEKTQE